MATEDQDLVRLVAEAESRFLHEFGRGPDWTAAAPGRVNLIGEHIDYNDGFVLPMAIGRHTVVTGAASEVPRLRAYASLNGERDEVDLDRPIARSDRGWANYIRGVVAGFRKRGTAVPGVDLLVHSSVPSGAGLSSSAALEVSVATLIEAATGLALDRREKAFLCQEAEHQFAGVPCGIMDQMVSVLGLEDHLLLIDCQTCETKQVPFEGQGVTVLITNTNVQHELADGEYERRRRECEEALAVLGEESYRDVTPEAVDAKREQLGAVGFRRARHVVTEMQRTTKCAAAAIAGDWERAGQLLYEGHASLRDDYEVSCPELDVVVAICERLGRPGGVYGCRMTGGGFGGSTVALVDQAKAAGIADRVRSEYYECTGIRATTFTSRPAAGAHLIRG